MNQTQLQFGRLLASSVDSLALRTASQRHALAAQTWINVTRLSARVHDVNTRTDLMGLERQDRGHFAGTGAG